MEASKRYRRRGLVQCAVGSQGGVARLPALLLLLLLLLLGVLVVIALAGLMVTLFVVDM